MKKWLVGLTCVVMGVAAAWGNLDTPATLPVEYAGASGWSNANLDAMDGWDATGLSSPYADSAKFDSAGDNVIIYFDGTPGEVVYSIRRSTATAPTNTYEAKVQESADSNTWADVRSFNDSELDATLKTFTNALSASSRYVKFVYVTKATGQNFGLGFVSITSSGAPVFRVTVDKTNGFTVAQGSSSAITATAANGTGLITYTWTSTLGGAYYAAVENLFTILATAPVGVYTSTVAATDSSSPAKTAEKTVTFSVVAPVAKYAITITPPVNGTVTTTPATEAVAGATVTITTTPAGGYAVDAYSVVGADFTPIGTSATFVMPAQAVIVTVTFKVFVAGSLIISEVADPSGTGGGNARFVEIYNAGGSSVDLAAGSWYVSKQVNGGTTWDNIALTGTVNAAGTYVVSFNLTNYTAAYPAAPLPNQTSGNISGNGNDGYFLYSGGNHLAGTLEDAYGVIGEDGTGKPWEYLDSRAARNTGVAAGNPVWTASEWTITSNAVYADMTPGVHPDGAAVFGVTVDKANGFTVDQGTPSVITATAANGTGLITYTWSSTLGATYYGAAGNVFTILATAPVGVYTSKVTATDSSDPVQTAEKSVSFSVVSAAAPFITGPITMVAGVGFSFAVPAGYTFAHVYGASALNASLGWIWTTLASPAGYILSLDGRTVTVVAAPGTRQVIRIGVIAGP